MTTATATATDDHDSSFIGEGGGSEVAAAALSTVRPTGQEIRNANGIR